MILVTWINGQSIPENKGPQDSLYKRCQDGLADCRGLPASCVSRKSCQFLALINLDPENVVELTLSAQMRNGQWIALGVSDDDHMGNDTVYECWLSRNGTASIHMSKNVGHTNTPMSEVNASALIQGREVQVLDGITTCRVFIPQSRFNKTQFMALLAMGNLTGDDSALMKLKHRIRGADTQETRLTKRGPSPVEVPKSTVSVSVSSASSYNRYINTLSGVLSLSLSILI